MESKNEKLQAIIDSEINGQPKQMADQIDEYNDMYSVFNDLKVYLIEELGHSYKFTTNQVLDIVIKYHRVKFR